MKSAVTLPCDHLKSSGMKNSQLNYESNVSNRVRSVTLGSASPAGTPTHSHHKTAFDDPASSSSFVRTLSIISNPDGPKNLLTDPISRSGRKLPATPGGSERELPFSSVKRPSLTIDLYRKDSFTGDEDLSGSSNTLPKRLQRLSLSLPCTLTIGELTTHHTPNDNQFMSLASPVSDYASKLQLQNDGVSTVTSAVPMNSNINDIKSPNSKSKKTDLTKIYTENNSSTTCKKRLNDDDMPSILSKISHNQHHKLISIDNPEINPNVGARSPSWKATTTSFSFAKKVTMSNSDSDTSVQSQPIERIEKKEERVKSIDLSNENISPDRNDKNDALKKGLKNITNPDKSSNPDLVAKYSTPVKPRGLNARFVEVEVQKINYNNGEQGNVAANSVNNNPYHSTLSNTNTNSSSSNNFNVIIRDENIAFKNDKILRDKFLEAKSLNRRNETGAVMHNFSLWGKSNDTEKNDKLEKIEKIAPPISAIARVDSAISSGSSHKLDIDTERAEKMERTEKSSKSDSPEAKHPLVILSQRSHAQPKHTIKSPNKLRSSPKHNSKLRGPMAARGMHIGSNSHSSRGSGSGDMQDTCKAQKDVDDVDRAEREEREGRGSREEGEIEDEEDEYYTEDEDHIHGDSEDEAKAVIHYVEDILDEEQQDLLDQQRHPAGRGQGRARLSFHLRNMVGNAKSLAANSGSAGSEIFQELIAGTKVPVVTIRKTTPPTFPDFGRLHGFEVMRGGGRGNEEGGAGSEFDEVPDCDRELNLELIKRLSFIVPGNKNIAKKSPNEHSNNSYSDDNIDSDTNSDVYSADEVEEDEEIRGDARTNSNDVGAVQFNSTTQGRSLTVTSTIMRGAEKRIPLKNGQSLLSKSVSGVVLQDNKERAERMERDKEKADKLERERAEKVERVERERDKGFNDPTSPNMASEALADSPVGPGPNTVKHRDHNKDHNKDNSKEYNKDNNKVSVSASVSSSVRIRPVGVLEDLKNQLSRDISSPNFLSAHVRHASTAPQTQRGDCNANNNAKTVSPKKSRRGLHDGSLNSMTSASQDTQSKFKERDKRLAKALEFDNIRPIKLFSKSLPIKSESVRVIRKDSGRGDRDKDRELPIPAATAPGNTTGATPGSRSKVRNTVNTGTILSATVGKTSLTDIEAQNLKTISRSRTQQSQTRSQAFQSNEASTYNRTNSSNGANSTNNTNNGNNESNGQNGNYTVNSSSSANNGSGNELDNSTSLLSVATDMPENPLYPNMVKQADKQPDKQTAKALHTDNVRDVPLTAANISNMSGNMSSNISSNMSGKMKMSNMGGNISSKNRSVPVEVVGSSGRDSPTLSEISQEDQYRTDSESDNTDVLTRKLSTSESKRVGRSNSSNMTKVINDMNRNGKSPKSTQNKENKENKLFKKNGDNGNKGDKGDGRGSNANGNSSSNNNNGSYDKDEGGGTVTEGMFSSPLRWRRGQAIGEGTFGRVYKGLNERTGELLAVKQLSLAEGTEAEVILLRKEIQVMWDLSHENIVRYLGTAQSEKFLFIILEYVPGGSIQNMLSQFGVFSESLIWRFSSQILSGVDYLHQKGVIHRDIKGANVLVTDAGVAKLADFGCSKQLPGLCTASLEESLRAIRGSVPWMAPEVIKQSGHGRSSDIWSFGATIIEMATGKPPWPEFTNNLAALFHVATSPIPPPTPPGLSPQCAAFLSRCMVIDANYRATAPELLSDPFLISGRTTYTSVN